MGKIVLFSALLLFMASCYHSPKDPEFNMALVIPADSMVSLLTDMHLADGIINSRKDKKKPTGEISAEYFDVILKKHHLDRPGFEESMRYYAYYTEKMDKIYDDVIINLSKLESSAFPKKEQEAAKDKE
jgi:hypothetical protein